MQGQERLDAEFKRGVVSEIARAMDGASRLERGWLIVDFTEKSGVGAAMTKVVDFAKRVAEEGLASLAEELPEAGSIKTTPLRPYNNGDISIDSRPGENRATLSLRLT